MKVLQQSDARVSLYIVAINAAFFVVAVVASIGIFEVNIPFLLSAYGVYRGARGVRKKKLSAWWGLAINSLILLGLFLIYDFSNYHA